MPDGMLPETVQALRENGPTGPVSIDNYEGNDVVVFLPSAGDFPPEGP
jgi:hypothetical protein